VAAPPVTALYSLGRSGFVATFECLRLLLTLALGIAIVPQQGAWGMAFVMAGARSASAIALYIVAHQMVKRATLSEDASTEGT
jgi:hypothetical protein